MDVVELEGFVQNYEWGKIGEKSLVYRLSRTTGGQAVANKPFAELWFGTHPSGPAKARVPTKQQTEAKSTASTTTTTTTTTKLLAEYVGGELPYLLKVLSVNKALSIQAHPDKKLAEKLHKEFPTLYKDPNHKPEMAIALTQFQVMCGFRQHKQIFQALTDYPEFKALVGKEVYESYDKLLDGKSAEVDKQKDSQLKAVLKKLFTNVMQCEAKLLAKQLESLLSRISDNKKSAATGETKELHDLMIRLSKEYPGDVGIFCPFFLNAFTLNPGEAVFLGPNIPHAYLLGDCVEIMACSDNVVRAGLTPKHRDVGTLCSMLTYEATLPQVMRGDIVSQQQDKFTVRSYEPPVEEFKVTSVNIANGKEVALKVADHSMLMVVEGKGQVGGKNIEAGSVLFVPSSAKSITVSATTAPLVAYFCSTNRK